MRVGHAYSCQVLISDGVLAHGTLRSGGWVGHVAVVGGKERLQVLVASETVWRVQVVHFCGTTTNLAVVEAGGDQVVDEVSEGGSSPHELPEARQQGRWLDDAAEGNEEVQEHSTEHVCGR